MRGLIGGAVVLSLLTGAASAQAPIREGADDEARVLFDLGRTAFNEGRNRDALQYFQRSHALSRRPQLLYNIGQVADRLREDELALESFEKYLEGVPDAKNRPAVESRIVALREAIERYEKSRAPAPAPPPEPSAEAPVVAPTAREVAEQQPVATDTPPAQTAPTDDDGSILTEWWFWTAVAVVAAGTVTVALVAGADEKAEPATPGNTGVVITTLELP